MRAKRPKIEAFLAAALVVAGFVLLALPRNWIERSGGTDAGDGGLFELALGLTPLVLGVALAVRLLWQRSGGRGGHITIPVRVERRRRR